MNRLLMTKSKSPIGVSGNAQNETVKVLFGRRVCFRFLKASLSILRISRKHVVNSGFFIRMNTADHENCALCNTTDFLPLRCRGCTKLFCSSHFSKAAHTCSSLAVASSSDAAKPTESLKSVFEAVERRHDDLFADGAGNEKVCVRMR
jgi:hypothetical protein